MEVRYQGEDWDWLPEQSLKGASIPQLAGRESGKKSGPAREERYLCFRVHEERDYFPVCPQKADHCLSELQRWARAKAINLDPRDRHEMLRLLPLPPKILCASAGHYLHHPGSCATRHFQGPEIQGQFPWKNTWCALGCSNIMPASATSGLHRIPIMTTVPLPIPGLSEQERLNQPLFNPLLSGWGRDS